MTGTYHLPNEQYPQGSVREKARMEKPLPMEQIGFVNNKRQWSKYNEHINSLKQFPAIGFTDVADGREVEYKTEFQFLTKKGEWEKTNELMYNQFSESDRRIVAVPASMQEEKVIPLKKAVEVIDKLLSTDSDIEGYNEPYNDACHDIKSRLLKLATPPQRSREQEDVKFGEWQRCPICDGHGEILAGGYISSVYQQCPTCSGNRVIQKPIISQP
jgi:hypothetical protein